MNAISKINATAWYAAIRPSIILVTFFSFYPSSSADVLPGAVPKDWPANQAKHQIVVRRESADKQQAAMILAAETTSPSKEAARQAMSAVDRDDPLGLAKPKDTNVEPDWWYRQALGIRIPCAVTKDAVTYYSDLVEKYSKQGFKRFIEPSSRLDYQASVMYHKEFMLEGKSFKNAHVVTLKLIFSQNFAATGTEGMRFEKRRVVVLDNDGKVVYVFGDGSTEVPILAI
jgi:hypothetical protein